MWKMNSINIWKQHVPPKPTRMHGVIAHIRRQRIAFLLVHELWNRHFGLININMSSFVTY
jgi:hypothetical protein